MTTQDSKIKELNNENFEYEIHQANGPILVDFWAEWCGPCKQMNPVLEELAHEIDETSSIVKVNVDKSPELARRFKVQSLPTFIVLENGLQIERISGVTSKDRLKALVSE